MWLLPWMLPVTHCLQLSPPSALLQQLVVEHADGTRSAVYDCESEQLRIRGGNLQLPPIPICKEWFSSTNHGTAKLLLLDEETLLEQQQAAEGAQQLPPPPPKAQELGRLYLRLAPAAEELHVMAAGTLFQGARVRLGGSTVQLQVGEDSWLACGGACGERADVVQEQRVRLGAVCYVKVWGAWHSTSTWPVTWIVRSACTTGTCAGGKMVACSVWACVYVCVSGKRVAPLVQSAVKPHHAHHQEQLPSLLLTAYARLCLVTCLPNAVAAEHAPCWRQRPPICPGRLGVLAGGRQRAQQQQQAAWRRPLC